MKDNVFTQIFLLSLGIGLVGFLAAINIFDPELVSWWQLIIIYSSLFLFLVGLTVFGGYHIRAWLNRNKNIYVSKNDAIRQGVLFVVCFEGLLFLQAYEVLNIWNGVALIGAIVLTEMYFMSRR